MKKTKNNIERCGTCMAEFEIWLNNSRISEERREKMYQHILEHCPVCTKSGEK